MATSTVTAVDPRRLTAIDIGAERAGALLGLGVTTLAMLTVLFEITGAMGGSLRLAVTVVLAVAVAWAAAQRVQPRTAGKLFAVIAIVSYVWYTVVVLDDLWLLVEVPYLIVLHTIDDAMSVATGRSVLALGATDTWAHTFAPAPLFLTWYFAFSRRYVAASALGGGTMLIFVFSGDLGMWPTLAGTIGVVMTLGLGTIETTNAPRRYAEGLLVLIAAMAVVALLMPLVPSGGAIGPLSVVDALDDEGAPTLEQATVGADGEIEIIGEVDMDPEIRYVVEGDTHQYVRTGAYDYYTGSGWERTGDSEPFSPLERGDPEPLTERIEQEVTPLVSTDRIPSAGLVHTVLNLLHGDLERTAHDSVVAPDGLTPNETFGVVSFVPEQPSGPTSTSVEAAGEEYLQLPDTVSPELEEVTDALIEGADGPHEKSQRIVEFLRNEKGYAHDVGVPSDDLASGFLFDMQAGYCTYFATTAVVMLRSADVPARMAVGYTNGQLVDSDTAVYRGMNSHAWPEVYIDGYGWVAYEPTPSDGWTDFRTAQLEEAREDGDAHVDLDETEDLPIDHEPTPEDPADDPDTDPDDNETDPINGNDTEPSPDEPNDSDDGLFDPAPGNPTLEEPPEHSEGLDDLDEIPDLADFRDPADLDEDDDGLGWHHLVAGGAVVLGVMATARRYRLPRRCSRQLRLRYHRQRGDPRDDLTRASDRLEWAMRRRFRPRRPGESLRTYHRRYRVVDDDPAVESLLELVEQARYAGDVDDAAADRAVDLADQIVDDTVVFGGRLRPSIPRRGAGFADRIL